MIFQQLNVDPDKTVGACYFWVQKVEAEHAQHEEHLKAENDGHIPFPPNYEYLNMRGKPFPWGMNSLFFNPHVCSVLSDRIRGFD